MAQPVDHPSIQALVDAINARDLDALDKVFTEDVVVERIAREIAPAPDWRTPWVERM